MADEIEKSRNVDVEQVIEALQGFSDPSIIISIFNQLGWTYSYEIQEMMKMAKQNANLSIKFKAIKQLREMLKEAAETAGYVANVSRTTPLSDGGHQTFHAKRIAGFLNPTKKIESTEVKESKNDQPEKEPKSEINRGCDGGQSQDETDTNSIFSADSYRPGETSVPETNGSQYPQDSPRLGGIESQNGGKISGRTCSSPDDSSHDNQRQNRDEDDSDSKESNPCIKSRPPTCDRKLFPGISTSAES